MEKISKEYIQKFNNKKRIYNAEQALADEIYSYFGKKLKFGMIMKFIKTKGYQFCYETWNEIKQSHPINREALFLYKIGQSRIIFKDNIGQTS